ncbi:MAG: VOC family protein [Dehalococcoidia bacterium]
MLPAIDHLVYAVPDLESGIEAIAGQLGVRAAHGGKHEGRGTHNALLSLGGRAYLEIIAPDPEQPEPSGPRPFGLDDLHEPGLVAWAMAVRDIEARVAAARDAGYDTGAVAAMSRRLPDGGELRWRLTFRAEPDGRSRPGDGLVPFLIEWESEPHPSATAPGGCGLVDLEAEHPRPAEVEGMLAALGVEMVVGDAARPALIATIEGVRGTVVLS